MTLLNWMSNNPIMLIVLALIVGSFGSGLMNFVLKWRRISKEKAE